jgi:hypothetical protein
VRLRCLAVALDPQETLIAITQIICNDRPSTVTSGLLTRRLAVIACTRPGRHDIAAGSDER